MTWATLTADGTFATHEGIPKYEEINAGVGGMIEAVYMGPDFDHAVMWINEEGKYAGVGGRPLPTNVKATAMVSRRLMGPDWICGNAVFTGDADEEGETMGLSPVALAKIAAGAK